MIGEIVMPVPNAYYKTNVQARGGPMQITGNIHGVPPPPPDRPTVRVCTNCGGEWMRMFLAQKIQEFQVLIGQAAPAAIDPTAFYLYECLACGFINQPALIYTGVDGMRRLYDELLKVIGEINDARKNQENSG